MDSSDGLGTFAGFNYDPGSMYSFGDEISNLDVHPNKFKKKIKKALKKKGAFEVVTPNIEMFQYTKEEGNSDFTTGVTLNDGNYSDSFIDTNTNNRQYDRKAVDWTGEIPPSNRKALMYHRDYLDFPVIVGTSSWISG